MQKENWLSVSADLRLAVAKDAGSLRFEEVSGGKNVRHFIAQVMDSTVGIALEEFFDWGVGAQRLEKLDLGVGQRDKNRGHAMVELRHLVRNIGAQGIAINLRGFANVPNGDGNVIEATNHDCPGSTFIIPARHAHGTSVSCPSARQLRRGRHDEVPLQSNLDRA